MSRITNVALVGITSLALAATALAVAQAAPLPASSGNGVGGASSGIEQVGWRRGYGPRYGHGYRRGNVGGALAAGAALGLIGGAIAASGRPRYYDYGYAQPVYGYGGSPYGGYPAFGYGEPYGYADPYGW